MTCETKKGGILSSTLDSPEGGAERTIVYTEFGRAMLYQEFGRVEIAVLMSECLEA